jgi:hypothetical protein
MHSTAELDNHLMSWTNKTGFTGYSMLLHMMIPQDVSAHHGALPVFWLSLLQQERSVRLHFLGVQFVPLLSWGAGA